jgi:HK97 gp10 family phage protein
MSVTVTGLTEAKATIAKLPETVTSALKAVAKRTADRIVPEYQRRLLSQTKAHKTAASARVLDESDEKQFTVNVPGHPDKPANLPRWLEYGTRHMVAKPSLRPAGDAESERYKSDMAAAAERAVREALE